MKSTCRLFTAVLVLVMLLTNNGLSALADVVLNLPAALKTIDEKAFYGDTSIDKVVLSEKVTEIRARAFANSSLSQINLPDSITFIDDSAFDGPEKVSVAANKGTYAYDWAVNNGYISNDVSEPDDFVIEDGVITEYVGMGKYVVVPAEDPSGNAVVAIGERAFSGCDSIVGIELPDGLQIIEKNAFENCSSLRSIHIPDGVTTLGGRIFEGCNNLMTVNYPKELNTLLPYETTWYLWSSMDLYTSPYEGCSKLTTITVPEGVTELPVYVFGGSSFNTVILPQSVRTIGQGAFEGSSLTRIVIPSGVVTIEPYTFKACNNLTYIYLGSNIRSIDGTSFDERCEDLVIHGETVSYAQGYANENGIHFIAEDDSDNVVIEVSAIGSYNGHTYQLIDTSMSWWSAKSVCEKKGGHLATITSHGEQTFIKSMLTKGSKNLYWLGGYADSDLNWHWITNEDFNYTNWEEGQPDHDEDAENKLEIYRSYRDDYDLSGLWNDMIFGGDDGDGFYSLSYKGFICEWDTISDNPETNDIRDMLIDPTAKLDMPTIYYPVNDNDVVPFEDLEVYWQDVTGAARYILSLRDLTLDELLLYHDVDVITSENTALISTAYLCSGHDYRVAVAAVPEGAADDDPRVAWCERLFSVSGEEDDGIHSVETQYGAGATVTVQDNSDLTPGLFVEYFQYDKIGDWKKDSNKRWEDVVNYVDFKWQESKGKLYSVVNTTDSNGNQLNDLRYLKTSKLAALFTGWIKVNRTGRYDLRLTGDDGVYLWLEGQNDPAGPNGWKNGKANVVNYKGVELEGQKWYRVEIHYYNHSKAANLKFEVKSSQDSDAAFSSTDGFSFGHIEDTFSDGVRDLRRMRKYHPTLATFDKKKEIDAIDRKLHEQSDQSTVRWVSSLFMSNVVDPFFGVEFLDSTFMGEAVRTVKERVIKALVGSVFENLVSDAILKSNSQKTIWQSIADKLGITDLTGMEIDADSVQNFIHFVNYLKIRYPKKVDDFLKHINPAYDYDWFNREVVNGLTNEQDLNLAVDEIISKYSDVKSIHDSWLTKINKAMAYKNKSEDERRCYIHLRLLERKMSNDEIEQIKHILWAGGGGAAGTIITDGSVNDFNTHIQTNPEKYIDAMESARIKEWFDNEYSINADELFLKQLLYDVRAQAAKEFMGLF